MEDETANPEQPGSFTICKISVYRERKNTIVIPQIGNVFVFFVFFGGGGGGGRMSRLQIKRSVVTWMFSAIP